MGMSTYATLPNQRLEKARFEVDGVCGQSMGSVDGVDGKVLCVLGSCARKL
jgi:hypothetical protein